jgi:hypothetical protein
MKSSKVTFFIEPEILDKLKTLSAITRIKQADYIREGIAYVLEKYEAEFKKAKRKEVKEKEVKQFNS